jgi:hypothetical protein
MYSSVGTAANYRLTRSRLGRGTFTMLRQPALQWSSNHASPSDFYNLRWFLYTLTASVVRVPGYRSRGTGSIPGATTFWEVVDLERGPLSLWVQLRSYLKENVAAPATRIRSRNSSDFITFTNSSAEFFFERIFIINCCLRFFLPSALVLCKCTASQTHESGGRLHFMQGRHKWYNSILGSTMLLAWS